MNLSNKTFNFVQIMRLYNLHMSAFVETSLGRILSLKPVIWVVFYSNLPVAMMAVRRVLVAVVMPTICFALPPA